MPGGDRRRAMKVHVRLWGYLTRYVPNRNAAEPTAIEVSEGAQVREAMQQLGIPDLSFDLVKFIFKKIT